jgi:hypothetical protein
MNSVTYDTGVLIAAERGDNATWLRHERFLQLGTVLTVPAPVLAQVWRGGSRQALLTRLLAGCEVEPMTAEHARAVGALLGAARHDDVVDGTVVEGAVRRRDVIVTADPVDIRRLVAAARVPLVVKTI